MKTLFILILGAFFLSLNQRTMDLDSPGFNEAIKSIESGEFGTFHSLIVIRDEQLELERYFNGWQADSLHQLQSATKSIILMFIRR